MSSEHALPLAHGITIGEAYRDSLQNYAYRSHMMIEIEEPVDDTSSVPDTSAPSEWDLTDWETALNLGDEYERYARLQIDDERTGRDWIENRIHEHLHGVYGGRLEGESESGPRGDQIGAIKRFLRSDPTHGSATNSLVAQIFHPGDLEDAINNAPAGLQEACNTQLQFKPDGNQLHMYATFRSQYLNSKAFGNFAGLAAQLAEICAGTDYEPGRVVEVTFNATMNGSAMDHKKILDELLG